MSYIYEGLGISALERFNFKKIIKVFIRSKVQLGRLYTAHITFDEIL
jgi:hypothetical protein